LAAFDLTTEGTIRRLGTARDVYCVSRTTEEWEKSVVHNFVNRGADRGTSKRGGWTGQVKCNIEGYKDPQNQALYFYKFIPPRRIESPPTFELKAEANVRLF